MKNKKYYLKFDKVLKFIVRLKLKIAINKLKITTDSAAVDAIKIKAIIKQFKFKVNRPISIMKILILRNISSKDKISLNKLFLFKIAPNNPNINTVNITKIKKLKLCTLYIKFQI